MRYRAPPVPEDPCSRRPPLRASIDVGDIRRVRRSAVQPCINTSGKFRYALGKELACRFILCLRRDDLVAEQP
jgi:hypothetical protein